MSRSTTFAGVALAVILAYPATSWFLGKQVEDTCNAQLHEQLSAVPYIKLVRNEYNRRIFDATQTVTLELPAALFTMQLPAGSGQTATDPNNAPKESEPAGESQENTGAGSEKFIQLTINTDIKHGPFPGFKALGAASAESRISFDPQTQKMVDAVFAGKSPLTASTFFGFTGGGYSVAHIAAFHYSAPKENGHGEYVFSGDEIAWRVDFSRGLKHYSMTGKAPKIELIDDAKLVINGMTFSSDQKRVFDDDPLLYSGKQRFTMEHIEAGMPEEKTLPIQIKNFVAEGEISAPGNSAPNQFLDMIAKMGIEEFKFGEQNYGPAHYDFSARHLNPRKLSALYRNTLEVYKYLPPNGDTPSFNALNVFQPILASLQDLTLDNAEFAVDRLSFNTPYGETRLSAKIKLNDAVKEDWYNPLMLIGKLDLMADLNVPEPLLNELLASKLPSDDKSSAYQEDKAQRALARQQAIQQQVARFIEQGYIKRADGMLKSRIEFHSGKLLCNDKLFNPFQGLAR